MRELLRVDNVSKSFPGVKALDGITFSLNSGEVRGLVGENGAGKSTLIKIITGAYSKDSGKLYFLGKEIKRNDPVLSRKLGIYAVYQDVMIAPDISVAENFFLGSQPGFFGFVNWRKMRSESRKFLNEIDLAVDVDISTRSLSLANKEMIAIAKVMLFNPKLVIFDEPTAVLTDNEKRLLFDLIRKLKKKNIGVIYISHNLEEVFEICDTVTVLKDGKVVGTYKTEEIGNVNSLIPLMVGRKIEEMYYKEKVEIGEEILKVEGLTGKKFKGVSFSLHSGEILGLYGLAGAGRTEIARAIFGADKIDAGSVFVKGKKVAINNAKDAIKLGIGYLPEDRRNQGVFPPQSVEFNVNIVNYQDILSKFFVFVNQKKAKRISKELINKLSIKASSITQSVYQLSGGNQQKVILARWLSRFAQVLILDEPTNGIDVGAKAEIYRLIGEIVNQGKSVIFISSYLPELIGICDRIIVISNGAVAGVLERSNFSEERLLTLAMSNVRKKEGAS
ncbi:MULTISPECIES: sugar ABC transporter ATP-binding protein [Pseudothermotoga]|jgi:ribose transport system ATP-binding protein|uniref:ABC transporter related n=2 Tax=Pseudothermotoga TaxID=1643951 RepID=A8F3M0_PSELT|nr:MULTISPECIES: sugar ABC transporter ATP-binding protein [Pseudothermotoga]ABV32754.1 ABC transporter related [Pseudothermotoga lettingae TMO]MDI3495270.1 ribose transport system ATP-binding protein [Pseudothermotoga sp.]MDK2885237.1 ribose transport system ATP-binding protein [Pseudothermotoga sp.]GLI48252.1 monosaccharide-transporting ATPase [Pseudothermotoga lettingae TMO]HBJ80479.1 sugar ABC transporter ATP-binding protein [Pseudothermotoga sp.]